MARRAPAQNSLGLESYVRRYERRKKHMSSTSDSKLGSRSLKPRTSKPVSLKRRSTKSSLVADLRNIGISAGDVVMVHAAVRKLGPIVGGVTTLVQSLLDAVGIDGTLVAYVDWEPGFEPYVVDPILAGDIPAFDKRIARSARDYGIFPEVVRTWPGAIRSDNPDAGVAAIGARSAWLCANHALSYGYGEGSPFAKLVAIDAKILMLGAPLDTITLLHHAEHMADLTGKHLKRYRRKVLIEGEARWVAVEEFDSSDPVVDGMAEDHFAQIAVAALRGGAGRRGSLGAADAYVFSAMMLHRLAVNWLEEWQRRFRAEPHVD